MYEIFSGGVPSPDRTRTLEGGNMQINTMTTSALAKGDNAQKALGTVCLDVAGDKGDMKQSVLFERVSARLKAQVGPDVYASWFARLKLHSHSKSVVRLTVPTTFLKSWINNRYLDLITSLFQAEDAEILKVEILVRTATRHGVKAPGVDEQTSSAGPASVAQIRRPAAQPAGQAVAHAVSANAAAVAMPSTRAVVSPTCRMYLASASVCLRMVSR